LAGLLITMEGVEGSGKSTQLQLLAARLRDSGIPLEVSKEPGGTTLGREIRSLVLEPHPTGETWAPIAELLLFYADRAQHVARLIRPALDAGKVVLLDRFEDSSRAYQGARGIDEGILDRLAEVVLGPLKPDLTLLLDLDPGASLVRVEARNSAEDGFRETLFDDLTLDFHRKVRDRFLAIARREPRRLAVIPAQGSPDEVAQAVWARVAPLLTTAGFQVS
jgi:dTMP kinase